MLSVYILVEQSLQTKLKHCAFLAARYLLVVCACDPPRRRLLSSLCSVHLRTWERLYLPWDEHDRQMYRKDFPRRLASESGMNPVGLILPISPRRH
jgi:hypothetical protein